MSSAKIEKLRLIPGPGPLCWLHPELLALDGTRANQGLSKADRLIDLGSKGWTGNELLTRIQELAPERIEIADGPRGHALWQFLNQALRGQNVEVNRPSPLPIIDGAEIDGTENDGIKFDSGGIEALLLEAARNVTPGGTVLFQCDHSGKVQSRVVGLTAQDAGSLCADDDNGEKRVWMLPLPAGPGLGDAIDKACEIVSQDPQSFRGARLIPVFLTELSENASAIEKETTSVETRLLPTWWGLLPGDRWPQALRVRYHELFRLLHPDRYFQFAAFENHALTGVDLFLEGMLERLGKKRSNARRERKKPVIIGICGTDGSGKSSHVAALKDYLIEKGLSVEVHKIYRHGVFHETVTDLTRQCAGGHNLHLWRLQRIVKVFDSIKYLYSSLKKPLAELDVVIFDRYTFTHFAAGVGRYHHDPFAREMLTVFPEADMMFLLDVPTDEALRRIGTRDEKTVDENYYMLSRYRHALCDLADRFNFVKLDATASIEDNRSAVLTEVTRLLEDRGLLGGDA